MTKFSGFRSQFCAIHSPSPQVLPFPAPGAILLVEEAGKSPWCCGPAETPETVAEKNSSEKHNYLIQYYIYKYVDIQ
jgi:hypothetical protein